MAKADGVNKSQSIRDYCRQHPGAKSKDVSAALAEQGIYVSENFVNQVKYKEALNNSRAKRKKGAGRGEERGGKSRAIREYFEAHPEATPRQVVTALEKQGTHVTEGLVSNIKYSLRRKHADGATERASNGRMNGSLSFEQLAQAKRLAAAFGGIEQAKHALDLLAQLQ
jgi:hypothetical protein